MKPSPQVIVLEEAERVHGAPVEQHRRIGNFIRDARDLDERQVEQILAYQREHGVRFGEAAVALRLAQRSDVIEALSQQFQYTVGFAGQAANGELVAAADPFGEQAEAFRELRSRLMLELPGEPIRALAIASPDSGDGKSYIAANLAVAFSQLGARTLLIDADVRTPRLHRMFGLDGGGLSGVLAGFVEPSEAVLPVHGSPNLCLLPAGAMPPNPLELLHRPTFGALIQETLQSFRYIFVDTPAAVRGADARAIAAECDATLVVGRAGRSRMAQLEGLLDALSRSGARLAGVVMNEH
jgi:protein-tyrosine kinase